MNLEEKVRVCVEEKLKEFKQVVQFDDQPDGRVEVKIYANDFQVYRVYSEGPVTSIIDALIALTKIERLPFPLEGRKSVNSHLLQRKVYYREIPAIIQDFDGIQGRVLIRPDNEERVFPPEPWDVDLSDETHGVVNNESVWEDILSPKLWWFRP